MNLTYKFVSDEEFSPIFKENRPKIFEENNDVNYMAYWSDEEYEKFKILHKRSANNLCFNLLCYDEEKLVGWSWGKQKDGEEFYMVNSAVFPEYRNRGIYKELMKRMIDKAKDEGFMTISSLHRATNNAVIVPKLKAGFKIVSMKIHARFGVLIELHYYVNEETNNLLDYRVGETKEIPKTGN